MIEEGIEEMIDLLEGAEKCFVEISKDLENFENYYNEIFRAFHSVKGAAGMLDLIATQTHFHELESQLENQRKLGFFTQEAIDYFLDGIDTALEHFKTNTEIRFDYSKYFYLNKISNNHTKEIPHNGLIYVVDDELDLANYACAVLNDHMFHARAFSSSKEMLDALKNESPDLIISDYKMPEMTGLELLKYLRKNHIQVPFIFMSGFISKEMLLESVKLESSSYIEKPFDSKHLVSLSLNAITKGHALTVLNSSIKHMIKYYGEVDCFLAEKGKNQLREDFKKDIENIISLRDRLCIK